MNTTTPIALVTGGSRGLGKNMALALAARGVDVVLTYRSNQKEGEAVVAEIERAGRKAAALQLDVGVASSFSRFAEQVREVLKNRWQRERFEYLVNNAGIGIHAPFAETTEAQFDELVNIQFKGPFFLIRSRA